MFLTKLKIWNTNSKIFFLFPMLTGLLFQSPIFSQETPSEESREADALEKVDTAQSLDYVQDPVPIQETEKFKREQERLPFPLSWEKRLNEDDIAEKKRGNFITGIPKAESNPINGTGIGGEAFFYINGDENDPFFNYTPYRQKYLVDFMAYENGRLFGAIGADLPFWFDKRWRARFDIEYIEEPNSPYFGIGSRNMRPLRGRNNVTGQRQNFYNMGNYLDNQRIVRGGDPTRGENPNLLATDESYNEFGYYEQIYNALFERVTLGGRLRFMFGVEYLRIRIEDYSFQDADSPFVQHGRTKLFEDANGLDPEDYWAKKNISGFDGGDTVMLAFAIIYDTRDLEPDPSRGIFLEYSHEISDHWMGSDFSFNKQLVQLSHFQPILPEYFKRVTLASNFMFGNIFGSNINFMEMFDLSSQSQVGGTPVLGGDYALRGFRLHRFVAPVTGMAQFELRTRLADFKLGDQSFTFSLVPLYDVGRVWDRMEEVQAKGWRVSRGIGARLAWNQSTIIRADYAMSDEDKQFFFGFDHVF
ncbi:MAG: BamA/TamA family outer membrane protein [Leptospira sp.]|nr:BamA/TamA family outer membrane protein [Leptospira sp.]